MAAIPTMGSGYSDFGVRGLGNGPGRKRAYPGGLSLGKGPESEQKDGHGSKGHDSGPRGGSMNPAITR